MNKNMIYIFIALFVMGMIGGCSKTAETLEEKLIAQEWSTLTEDGTVVDMVFYKNHTAVAGSGILSKAYEWSIENNQITLAYTSYDTVYTLLFDIEDDGADGYIFNIVECQSAPNSDRDNSENMERYKTVKLTAKN